VRLLKHLLTPHWLALRAFPPATLKQIEAAIKASERQHDGELRFVVEASLPFSFLSLDTRKRAEALFAQLGVWDTGDNSGVLIYVQLVDRQIEIAQHGERRLPDGVTLDDAARVNQRHISQQSAVGSRQSAVGSHS